jgi:hypothetical protein
MRCSGGVLEILHTHLGFIFPKVFPCLLVIIIHYPVSYILGEHPWMIFDEVFEE